MPISTDLIRRQGQGRARTGDVDVGHVEYAAPVPISVKSLSPSVTVDDQDHCPTHPQGSP